MEKENKLRDNIKSYALISEQMCNLYIKKNHDYGDSFSQSCDEFGLISPAIRLTDKLNRFKSLISKDSLVTDESVEDTLLDLANYSIMTLMWMRKQKNKENREQTPDSFCENNLND